MSVQRHCRDSTSSRQWRYREIANSGTCCSRYFASQMSSGCSEIVLVPRANKGSRCVMLFELFAIQLLLLTETITGVISTLRTEWDHTRSIVQGTAARGEVRKNLRHWRDGGFTTRHLSWNKTPSLGSKIWTAARFPSSDGNKDGRKFASCFGFFDAKI